MTPTSFHAHFVITMSKKQDLSFATTYTVLATIPDDVTATATAVASPVALDMPLRTVNPQFGHIPETQNLVWTDDFFEDDDGVVAVFDFDYEKMESFYTKIGWIALSCTIFFKPLMIASLVGLAPCYLRKNVQWNVNAQHVAITRDGIRFVRDKHATCWGNQCTDAGKSSKTVPFDKITDCDIEEPAGNACLCVEKVLSTVNIDTASSGQGRHELQICGLKDPHNFKKLVWAMKRNMGSLNVKPQALEMMRTSGEQNTNADVSTLLREIRDELRYNNSLLQTIQPVPSAPSSHQEVVV